MNGNSDGLEYMSIAELRTLCNEMGLSCRTRFTGQYKGKKALISAIRKQYAASYY